MKEELFLILGTGQMVLKSLNDRNYRLAKYYLPSNSERIIVETPFVGEAIIKLFPNRFSKIYILGTKKSMWETLYAHSVHLTDTGNSSELLNEEDLKYFGRIAFAVEHGDINESPELLDIVAAAYQKLIDVPTECRLIPIGENDAEIWQIFDILTNIQSKDVKISFDITHGLRFQPYFLLTSLFYMNSANSSIKIGSIFYGGLELMFSEIHKGAAPILEFKVFAEMIEWINAAKIYSRYKDFSPLAELLGRHKELENVAKSLNYFSLSYRLNQFNNIETYANEIISQFDQMSDSSAKPLNIIKDTIVQLPYEVANCENRLDTILHIAKHQLKYKNYGFVIIALWEAVIEKCIVTLDNQFNNQAVHSIMPRLIHYNFRSELEQINKNMFNNLKELRKIRNTLAHLDENNSIDIEIEELVKTTNNLYNYFSGNLRIFNFNKIRQTMLNLLN